MICEDDEGTLHVPVWPHSRFAAACVKGDWSSGEAQPIEMKNWFENWIPGMIESDMLIAVFPDPSDLWLSVTPEKLRDELFGDDD